MLLRLIRKETRKNSVLGQLWIIDSIMGDQLLCDTLENNNYLIPELIYRVHVTHSPKFRRLLPLICQVPGRSGIRIHVGNQSSDSTGCILVGKAQGARLTDSKAMEQQITELLHTIDLSGEDIRLDVTHFIPDYPAYSDHDASHDYGVAGGIVTNIDVDQH